MKKISSSVRRQFNALPSAVKVIIYSGVSTLLATLLLDIEGDAFMWQEYAKIPVTIAINLVTYLTLREKEESE